MCCGGSTPPCGLETKILLEILSYRRFNKKTSTWWYTDNKGLWGDFPYLHLGKRRWIPNWGCCRALLHPEPGNRANG